MLATRAASRIALRSLALRRGIHSGERGNGPRSSAITAGLVIASAGFAVSTYVSYKSSGNAQSTLGEKYDKVRQNAPEPKSQSAPAKKSAPPKSQSASSVDSPTPSKPSPSEPGVLEPTSKPDSDKPADKSSDSSSPDKAEDMDSLESDAANQGAFNPETGEINWDCPCLGGMAHGPCGPHFREAFSCFVYSKEEPKGVDCVEKFKAMQDCFREHPDVYGEEIDDEEEANLDSPDVGKEAESTKDQSSFEPTSEKKGKAPSEEKPEAHAEKKSEAPAKSKSKAPAEKKSDTTTDKNPEKDTEQKSDSPSENKAGAPSTPTKDPESRTRVPTANVSPDATPSKSSAKH